MRRLSLVIVVALLSGCATPAPFDLSGIDATLTPARALAAPEAARGKAVLWGGLVLEARNLRERTEIELLAYPLRENGLPERVAAPLGRFVLTHPGYLETLDYAAGRWLTALGRVKGLLEGRLGENAMAFPLLEAEQLRLWPKEGRALGEPQLHFGIGVIYNR